MFECKWKSTSITWYRNKRRRQLTDAAQCLWYALKDCSDRWGAIEGDEDELAHALFSGMDWDEAKVHRCLRELVDVGLVSLFTYDDSPWVQVLKHDEHQSPSLTRKRGERKTARPFGNGSNSRDFRPLPVKGGKGPLISVSVSGSDKQLSTPNGVVSANGRSQTSIADVQSVFDHWQQTFSKRSTTVLDDKRKRRIVWALKTYGLDQSLLSITGYGRDDWEGRAKHHDITLLFRDADHLERGLELSAARNGVADGKGRFAEYDRLG